MNLKSSLFAAIGYLRTICNCTVNAGREHDLPDSAINNPH